MFTNKIKIFLNFVGVELHTPWPALIFERKHVNLMSKERTDFVICIEFCTNYCPIDYKFKFITNKSLLESWSSFLFCFVGVLFYMHIFSLASFVTV